MVDGVKILENSQNLIVYGHDMKDGSMFGGLQDYEDVNGFYSEHPIIELSSNYETYKYKIFAYFIIDAEDETETKFDCWNTLNFAGEDDFYEFVNNAKNVRSHLTMWTSDTAISFLRFRPATAFLTQEDL